MDDGLCVVGYGLCVVGWRGRFWSVPGSQPYCHFPRLDDVKIVVRRVANVNAPQRYDGVVSFGEVTQIRGDQRIRPSGNGSIDYPSVLWVVTRWIARGIVRIINGHSGVLRWNKSSA